MYRLGAPRAQFYEYYDEGCDRHRPGEHHEEPMPLRTEEIDSISSERKAREKGDDKIAFLLHDWRVNDVCFER